MPVKIGDNLTLEDNKLSAVYKELYTKLNKAYAWTYNKSTSSGGTGVLIGSGNIITNIECPDINQCYAQSSSRYTTANPYVICNGIIYDKIGTQQGNKTDWKLLDQSYKYAIDSEGYLYKNFITKYGTLKYTKVAGDYAISDGNLYYIGNNTPYQMGTENTWTDIICASSYGFGISNGYLYTLNSTTLSLLGTENNWVKLMPGAVANGYHSVLNSNNEAYFLGYNTLSSYYTTNVKKIITLNCWDSWRIILKNDNKLYYRSWDSSNDVLLTSDNTLWSDIAGTHGETSSGNTFYAIGDGKLYFCTCNTNSSTISYTQLGTENNYVKINGEYLLSIAWTGEATTFNQTVLTTKQPLINDDIYIDENLTKYSSVQSTTGVTITDQYRTYNRDASKDSSFTKIPPASMHETITTIDILRATNPNN